MRYLGVSNVSGWQLQKIVDFTKLKGYEPLTCLQVCWNLQCCSTVCDDILCGFDIYRPSTISCAERLSGSCRKCARTRVLEFFPGALSKGVRNYVEVFVESVITLLILTCPSGWLTGKVTREGAPEGSRINFYKEQAKSKPMYRYFAKEGDEVTWAIIDALKAVANELGNVEQTHCLLGPRRIQTGPPDVQMG